MKVFIALAVFAAVALAKEAPEGLKDVLKEAAGQGEKPAPPRSTILAGLNDTFIAPPRKLSKEEMQWLLQPLRPEDAGDLKGLLEKVGGDLFAIAQGFIQMMDNGDFSDFGQLKKALEGFFMKVIVPRELDLEGVKDYVEGLVVRAVMSGTAFPELKEKNERGCIDLKDEKKNPRELACLLTKFDLLEKAIQVREMILFQKLFDNEEPMEFCDQVYRLFDLAYLNGTEITANMVAKALGGLSKCLLRNGERLEMRTNPDAPGPEGRLAVPNLPIPRLIHLSVKMQAYEFMGMQAYHAFQAAEGFFMFEGPIDEPKYEEVRDLEEQVKEKVAAFKEGVRRFNGTGEEREQFMDALKEKLGERMEKYNGTLGEKREERQFLKNKLKAKLAECAERDEELKAIKEKVCDRLEEKFDEDADEFEAQVEEFSRPEGRQTRSAESKVPKAMKKAKKLLKKIAKKTDGKKEMKKRLMRKVKDCIGDVEEINEGAKEFIAKKIADNFGGSSEESRED